MKLHKIFAVVLSACMLSSMAVTASADWYQTENGYAYMYANGDIADTGWLQVGRHTYYINSKGVMQTGWIETSSGSWYYMDSNGRMLKNAWARGKSGAVYYFDSNGKMYNNQWLDVDATQRYYFGANGKMYRSRWIHTTSDSWYYALNSGLIIRDKIAYFDNIPYLFNANGKLVAIGMSQINAYRKQQAQQQAQNNSNNSGDNSNNSGNNSNNSGNNSNNSENNSNNTDNNSNNTGNNSNVVLNDNDMVYIKTDGDSTMTYHIVDGCHGASSQVAYKFALNSGFTKPCEVCVGSNANNTGNNDDNNTGNNNNNADTGNNDDNNTDNNNNNADTGNNNSDADRMVYIDYESEGVTVYHYAKNCGNATNRVTLDFAKQNGFTIPCSTCVGSADHDDDHNHDHDHDYDHDNNNSDDSNISDPVPDTSRLVYATPAGRVYHYDGHCDGATYYATTWEIIEMRGLIPCDKCVK